MEYSSNSPLNWLGGKNRHIKKLWPYLPKEFKYYIEPFAGGLSLGLMISKHINPYMIIINDLDTNLYNFWLDVMFDNVINNYKKLCNLNFEKAFIHFEKIRKQYLNNKLINSWDFLFLNKLSWGGITGKSKLQKLRFDLNYHKNSIPKLKDASKLLSDATILNNDYKELNNFNHKESFWYLDPPYEIAIEKSYYKHQIDFKELLNFCKTRKGKFMLSINDSNYIRNLFKDFYIYDLEINYATRNNSRKNKNNTKHEKELIITNYPKEKELQISLFD